MRIQSFCNTLLRLLARHKASPPLPCWLAAERRASDAAGGGSEARADAGSSQLQANVRGLGGCATSHAQGTGPDRAFSALVAGSPWVVVTVPALVPWARMCGWSRESATTARVTGAVLIPFGSRQVPPSLLPPRRSDIRSPLSGDAYDTAHSLWPCPSSPRSSAPAIPPARRRAPGLPPHAAGIDIGDAEHGVAVPPHGDPQPVRRFGTCTTDLDALADWLLDCGVTTVAMESTGVSWMPLFERLEARGVQGLLMEPRHAKRVPGRPQTDRLDCQWLQRLHSSGLLAGALRPADQGCVLRSSLASPAAAPDLRSPISSICPRPWNRCPSRAPRWSVPSPGRPAWRSARRLSQASAPAASGKAAQRPLPPR